MPLTLYMAPLSPPSRAVLVTAKALNLQLDIKELDLSKGDHRKPDFLKINPQHAVPTLVDNGLIICDSHAINAYLVQKYGKNDLYPKDFGQRALVDQRLHFDTGNMFKFIREIAGPIFYGKTTTVPQEKVDGVLESFGVLEKFLEQCEWVAGNDVTIADFSLFTTVTALCVFVGLDEKKFPKIKEWMERFRELPYAFVQESGLEEFEKVVNKCMT